MAFNDSPIVDDNSLISEESVLLVNQLFKKKNGFISRVEHPDYGVDVDLELIENRNATSKKLAVQIKSSDSLDYIKDDKFISLAFKTSRIGYLSRRPPAYGIVIIYDDSTEKAYYEYVENIVQELDNLKGESWRSQKFVNIHVSVDNYLDESAVKSIHKKAIARHENHDLMIANHGKEFGIPNLEFDDIDEPFDLLKSLEDHGSVLINRMEFDLLLKLINRLAHSDIIQSKKLLLLTIIATIETGQYIDAEFYIQKSRAFDYSESDSIMIKFSILKRDFAMGDIDFEKYHDEVEALTKSIPDIDSRYLVLKINLIYSKVNALFKRKSRLKPATKTELLDLFEEIENANIEERIKYFLLVYNAENFHGFALREFISFAGDFQMRERLGKIADYSENLPIVQNLLSLINHSENYYKRAIDFAKATDDKLLLATAMDALADHFLSVHFQLAGFNDWRISENEKSKAISVYQNNFNWAISAFQVFTELGHKKDSLNSILCAYNIKRLFEYTSSWTLEGLSFDEINSILSDLLIQTGISNYISVVDMAIADYENKDKEKWDFDDDEIDIFAESMLKALSLPRDRLIHIVNDIKAHQFFYKNCKNGEIELHQKLDHQNFRETHYASPCKYILVNNITRMQSISKTDVKALMQSWDLIE